VKTCPHCDGEIRDSVVRCTHCRRNLRDGEIDLEATPPASPPGRQSSPSGPHPVAASAPSAPSVTVAAGRKPSAAPFGSTPPRDTWSNPVPSTSPLSDPSAHRAIANSRRAFGPDMWMLWAGMAATVAGILAFLAVKEPWAHLTITQPATDTVDALVVEVTVRGHAAFVGTAGTVLALMLAASGLLWFFYGFQRGWSMPGILNPALAILVTVAGLGVALLSSMVWFVWQDAMIARAENVGLTTREMTQLLDQQPIPIVVIERLPGLIRFGGMMALGLFASCLGWWAYRRRS